MILRKQTIFIFTLLSLLTAQVNTPIIAAILVSGNDVTEERIVLRELSFKPGDAFDEALLSTNRDRLYNLGIFEQVAVYPSYQSSDSVIITVQLVETIRLLPIPLFYYRDDVGWSYGGGLTFLNYRGRDQRLILSGTLGGEKTYVLSFADPWFTGDRVSLSWLAARYFRDHPVYPFRSTITVVSATIGKWYFNKRLLLSTGLGYTNHNQSDNQIPPGEYVPPFMFGAISRPEYPKHYQYFYATIAVSYHGTDVWRDPTRGIKASLQIIPNAGWIEPDYRHNFTQSNGSLATFKSITSGKRPLVLAGGVRFRTNWGSIPNYGQNYLGGLWVRGYDIVPANNSAKVADRLEGKNVISSSVELRQTLLKRKLYLEVEIGLSMIAFTDLGWAFNSLDDAQNVQPVVGYGLGLRLFMPTVQALAIDWGFNPYDSKRHVRFSLGQRF